LARKPRFLFTSSTNQNQLNTGDQVDIIDSEHHQLKSVLRLKTNQEVILVNSATFKNFLGKIIEIQDEKTVTEVISEINLDSELPRIHLVSASIKPANNDFILEKAVELGATSVSVFNSEHSSLIISPQKKEQRLARLEKISAVAAKQSGSQIKPEIYIDSSLPEALSRLHGESPKRGNSEFRLALLSPGKESSIKKNKESQLVTEYFNNFKLPESNTVTKLENNPENAEKHIDTFVLVGPEGGFSSAEFVEIERFDYQPVSLGPTVLRSETAAIVAVGVIRLLLLR
jgi:16S rRNA (uracil1498-N3)-methyltransferase